MNYCNFYPLLSQLSVFSSLEDFPVRQFLSTHTRLSLLQFIHAQKSWQFWMNLYFERFYKYFWALIISQCLYMSNVVAVSFWNARKHLNLLSKWWRALTRQRMFCSHAGQRGSSSYGLLLLIFPWESQGKNSLIPGKHGDEVNLGGVMTRSIYIGCKWWNQILYQKIEVYLPSLIFLKF